MTIPLLSFFTGGGFFDIGFTQAGFSVCWTNENHPPFVLGYESGMSSWLSSFNTKKASHVKITNTESICNLQSKTIFKEAFHGSFPKHFGIIGGPPCPDFSHGGVHAGGSGTNGRLTTVFVSMICKLNPSFFVLENVAGLYRIHKHHAFLNRKIAKLRANGYIVDYTILNALELGVPQNRERLFVIGFKKSIAPKTVGHKTTARIGWFPWPTINTYSNAKQLVWPQVEPFGGTPKKPSDIPIELTVYHALRGNGNPEKIANGKEYFIPYSSKFEQIQEGDVSRKSFKRLHRYRYSPTAWYGNQEVHLHPWKARRLSVREALRIQSVPDEYVLPETISLSAKFKMICNGVPCTMAFHLAKAIRSFLSQVIE